MGEKLSSNGHGPDKKDLKLKILIFEFLGLNEQYLESILSDKENPENNIYQRKSE